MVAVSLKFTAGRYHATPWGSHVNEGAVEWPPSQWRFLRALIATWHAKYSDRIKRRVLESLIEALSSPPKYHLPPASTQHTRHYMPGGKHKEGLKRDVSLVLDSFVAVKRCDRTVIVWPETELEEETRQALKHLLNGLAYLGRAESWLTAEIADDFGEEINCFPLNDSMEAPAGMEVVDVACTMGSDTYRQWQEEAYEGILQLKLAEKKQKKFERGRDTSKAKLTSRDRKKVREEVPPTLTDALEVSTKDLRKAGWSDPPGYRKVRYLRPAGCFSSIPSDRAPVTPEKVSVVRYAVKGAVLPRITKAVWIGERVRKIVMGIAGRINDGFVPWTLSGKTPQGKPKESDHSHAYYLCESCCGRGKISHITVFSRHGFDEQALEALVSLRKVWGSGGYDLQLVPIETGYPRDFGGLHPDRGESPILATSRTWVSVTPFVPTRHPKLKSSEKHDPDKRSRAMTRELENQVRLELDYAGIQEPEEVELLPEQGISIDGHFTRWLKFKTRRLSGGGSRVNLPGNGFRIRFPEPVTGPITLGYAAHFGLGQFIPED